MEFLFTNDVSPNRTDEVVDYLLGPRLWIASTAYPDLADWAQKVHTEILKEKKRAMIAYFNGQIAGVAIYQKHRSNADALEIKNLTVRPDVRGRHVADFLLRNTEVEGSLETGSTQIVGDAKADNLLMRMFLLKNGYRVVGKEDIYHLGTGEDLIYTKNLLRPGLRA